MNCTRSAKVGACSCFRAGVAHDLRAEVAPVQIEASGQGTWVHSATKHSHGLHGDLEHMQAASAICHSADRPGMNRSQVLEFKASATHRSLQRSRHCQVQVDFMSKVPDNIWSPPHLARRAL